ncbi:MAG: PepSY domain-containing protein [Gammaproteobacteria bacterium]|nr:PepSY domain-containing protein [Gammaproteobacteria bacterium]
MRKTLFWLHLGTGVVAGLVILMMSMTGVLLTYERQMISWADRAYRHEPLPGQTRQPLAALLDAAQRHVPEASAASITIAADAAAPAVVSLGRGRDLYLQPYSGEVLGEGSPGIRQFFRVVTSWHRWFDAGPESRATMRAITGACNLAFLFLILSGLYLWIPHILRWPMFRARLLFSRSYKTSKGRDFNWHHVFGIWSAIPLAAVVATGVVISYPWASDLVYRSVGEEPPARGGPPGPPGAMAGPTGAPGAAARGPRQGPGSAAGRGPALGGPGSGSFGGRTAQALDGAASAAAPDLDALFARAAAHLPAWRTIALRVPGDPAAPVGFSIDQGSGGQPQKRHNLTLDARTGDVVAWEPWDSQSPGRRLRSYLRFLHTGETLGIAGQTIAGLVSFASIILVWTGIALAWRRLIQPLFRKKQAK